MACSKLWLGRRLSDVGGFLADLGAHLIDEASIELSRALGEREAKQSLAAGGVGRTPFLDDANSSGASAPEASFKMHPSDPGLRRLLTGEG